MKRYKNELNDFKILKCSILLKTPIRKSYKNKMCILRGLFFIDKNKKT